MSPTLRFQFPCLTAFAMHVNAGRDFTYPTGQQAISAYLKELDYARLDWVGREIQRLLKRYRSDINLDVAVYDIIGVTPQLTDETVSVRRWLQRLQRRIERRVAAEQAKARRRGFQTRSRGSDYPRQVANTLRYWGHA